jgi:hypothetical protein
MHHPTSSRHTLFVLVLATAGCQEFFTLEEACDPGFTGKNQMTPEGVEAFDRMNCYRRLSGVSKATGSEIVNEAADNEMNYILLNPDPMILGGPDGIGEYLRQDPERAGFTGLSIRERLEAVNYAFYDPVNTISDEIISIQYRKAGQEAYSTERAVDEQMRQTRIRQIMQQPSWLDGGYAQLELDKAWLEAAGETDFESATIFYTIAIYTVPHLEHASTPVLLPKEDQEQVPLYWNTLDYSDFYQPIPARISWPVSFLVGTLDVDNYHAVDQNPYEVKVTSQEITNTVTGEALATHVVHPGDEIAGVWPDGNRQRWIVGIYATQPYEPLTKYRVVAEMTTVDGTYDIDYEFTTMAAEDDPGFLDALPPPPEPTTTLSRRSQLPFAVTSRSTPAIDPAVPASRLP